MILGWRPRRPDILRAGSGIVGAAILAAVLLVALAGPLVSPHSAADPIGAPGQGPSGGALLGTDALGRDVLSRLLHGGLTVVWIGGAATLLAYLAGMAVGLVAGYSRSIVDPLLMRGVDLLLALPGLLLLLLLVTGLGAHPWVVILGVALVQLPGIARVVRTATLEAAQAGYVEAAVVRGERSRAIMTREILPNIAPLILADFGVRFAASIILIASMNYLGLGLAPPAADWGLMISENRQYIALNPWACLAPAIMLALLTISVNLVADAYLRTAGTSANRSAVAEQPRISNTVVGVSLEVGADEVMI